MRRRVGDGRKRKEKEEEGIGERNGIEGWGRWGDVGIGEEGRGDDVCGKREECEGGCVLLFLEG